MEIKKLLSLRKQIKSRKPNFIRQEHHKRKRLAKKWRQPKGMHSKLRQKFKSHIKHPSPGFGAPKKIRGLDRGGLKPVIASNIDELNYVSKDQGVIIGKNVGLKKKIGLLRKAKEKGIVILNVKNIDEFLKRSEDYRKSKKEEMKKKEDEKDKIKQELVKKADEKSIAEKEKEEKKKVLESPR